MAAMYSRGGSGQQTLLANPNPNPNPDLDEPQAAQEARVAAVAAPPPQAELYYDALLGPLCASLDVWRATYTHRLPDAGEP